jgi:hypothetical protein
MAGGIQSPRGAMKVGLGVGLGVCWASLFGCDGPVSVVLPLVANDRHKQVCSAGMLPSCDSPPCKGIGG